MVLLNHSKWLCKDKVKVKGKCLHTGYNSNHEVDESSSSCQCYLPGKRACSCLGDHTHGNTLCHYNISFHLMHVTTPELVYYGIFSWCISVWMATI